MKCPTSKHQFKYKYQAVKANKSIGLWTGEYFNIYHCLLCGDYHLASRRGVSRRGKKFRY